MSEDALRAEIREVKDLLQKVVGFLGLGKSIEDQDRAEFPDIDPVKLYEVSELVALRGGTPQSYYKAIKARRLKDTPGGGRTQVRGRDLIAWLRSKRPGA